MDRISSMIAEISHRKEFIDMAFKALSFNEIAGDYAEFGCASAQTFRCAHSAATSFGHKAHFWAFDSFEGLPPRADARDSHPRWEPGKMRQPLPGFLALLKEHGMAEDSYSVVKGFYDTTLREPFDGARPDDICFAYVDCDLHSSTVAVLDFLRPRLKHGMIIALDDYYCYSADQLSGERAAFVEFAADVSGFRFLPYRPFGWHGMSFIVESASLIPSASAKISHV
ncbi:TylF/MycF/NovP-related O-methyltransferase [Parvibaculum sp.]|uniref:TylF/MycF/NovP-related O-methyltransferase n=1 Tax=Parvibaculum sp. TaxID=2024848 RepID=UPI002FDB91F3